MNYKGKHKTAHLKKIVYWYKLISYQLTKKLVPYISSHHLQLNSQKTPVSNCIMWMTIKEYKYTLCLYELLSCTVHTQVFLFYVDVCVINYLVMLFQLQVFSVSWSCLKVMYFVIHSKQPAMRTLTMLSNFLDSLSKTNPQ